MNVCCLKLKRKQKHVTVCLLHGHPNLICHTVRFYFIHKPNFLHWVQSAAALGSFSSRSPLFLLPCSGFSTSLFTPLSVWVLPNPARAENAIPGAACWGSSILNTHRFFVLFFFLKRLFICLLYFYCNRPCFASVAHDAGLGRSTQT